jgi:hypothetical protein
MKHLVVYMILVNLIGCTTLRPVEGTAAEIRERILSGQVLKAGDRVRVQTISGGAYAFTVTDMRDGMISGRDVSIPVTQIAGLLKRELSVGKTAVLVGGLILTGAVMANGNGLSGWQMKGL